jgi:hypothetical protein
LFISLAFGLVVMAIVQVRNWTARQLDQLSESKSKAVPLRHAGIKGEKMYSTYSFLASVIHGGEWSASSPDRALPPGKGPPVSIGQETGWVWELVWTQRVEGISYASAGIELRPSSL